MKKPLLFPLLILFLAACSLQPAPQVAAPAKLEQLNCPNCGSVASLTPPPVTDTATLTPTLIPSSTPSPSLTPTPTPDPLPNFPLELTRTPGILATATAYAAMQTAIYLQYATLFGSMADMLGVMQYFNPVGAPLKVWHGVPIMPAATAGQEYRPDIYSYKAKATLDSASRFYTSQVALLHWTCNPLVTGYAGTGINADHSATLTCGSFIIDITSFDNDTAHVIVVINKAP
jgi:hypothetical protein